MQTWEQPAFQNGLDAIAVDLITAEVRKAFAALDPVALVATEAAHLDQESRRIVAELIDTAVVEIDVAFTS